MPDDKDLEARIRQKAHALWEEEGRPEGRAQEHWDKARILVAIEDDRSSLKPVAPEHPEESDIQENLGEFPAATTDEGDRQPTPSRRAERTLVTGVARSLRESFTRRRS